MSDPVNTTLDRARNHPLVAGLVLVGIVIIAVANTGTAFERIGELWGKWTRGTPTLDSTWQGDWTRHDGPRFSFVMNLVVSPNNSARGTIRWTLRDVPPGFWLTPRLGDEAIETVSGTFDRETGVANLQGDGVSDTTLIATDVYKFQVLEGGRFQAMTETHKGRWDAKAEGKVIVSARHE